MERKVLGKWWSTVKQKAAINSLFQAGNTANPPCGCSKLLLRGMLWNWSLHCVTVCEWEKKTVSHFYSFLCSFHIMFAFLYKSWLRKSYVTLFFFFFLNQHKTERDHFIKNKFILVDIFDKCSATNCTKTVYLSPKLIYVINMCLFKFCFFILAKTHHESQHKIWGSCGVLENTCLKLSLCSVVCRRLWSLLIQGMFQRTDFPYV